MTDSSIDDSILYQRSCLFYKDHVAFEENHVKSGLHLQKITEMVMKTTAKSELAPNL